MKWPASDTIVCVAVVVVLSLPIALISLSVGYYPMQVDETTLGWAGKQVGMGQIPYRDYFCIIPPFTLYYIAALFRWTGPELASLRMLTLAYSLAIPLILFAIFARAGIKKFWAVLIALIFPFALFSFWPLPSHHWLACGSGLIALFFIAGTGERRWEWVLAGFFAGLTFLTLQTEGTLICALVALSALCAPRRKISFVLTVAAMAATIALMALYLWVKGALTDAVHNLIVWPMLYYKQPGGFNDVNYFACLADSLSHAWPHGISAVRIWMAILMLSLPVLSLASLCAARDWSLRPMKFPPRWLENCLGFLVVMAVYFLGRSGLVHIAFYSPYLLVVSLTAIRWEKEILRPRIWQIWTATLMVLSLLYWAIILPECPPSFENVAAVDDVSQREGVVALVRGSNIPADSPVLYLPHGSDLYFYHAPLPPPVDWILPPSSRANAPSDYTLFAEFAVNKKVPYILIDKKYLPRFLNEPSALQSLLANHYRYLAENDIYVLYTRR